MNGDVHDVVRSRIADDDIDELVGDHLIRCQACAAWEQQLSTIRSTSAVEASPTDSQVVDRIVTAVTIANRQQTRRRFSVIGGGAVAASVAAVIGIVTLTGRSNEPDRLAEIATGYEATSTRFVFQAAAQVPLPDATAAENLQPVSVRRIPTCDNNPPTTAVPTGIELEVLLTSLLTDDPCLALDSLESDLAPRVQTALKAVSTRKAVAQQRADMLSSLPSADNALLDESRRIAVDDATAVADQADHDLADIVSAYNASVDTLAPLAQAAIDQLPTTGFQPAARDAVVALSAVIDSSKATTPLRIDVVWDTVATGTWTANQVTVSGTTTTDQDSVAHDFATATDDPTNLAAALLGRPATLTEVLRSAPPSKNSTIRWQVPRSVLSIPDDAPVSAVATLTASGLDRLTLTATSARAGQIVITFIPAR
jgi:hypothetical protein